MVLGLWGDKKELGSWAEVKGSASLEIMYAILQKE